MNNLKMFLDLKNADPVHCIRHVVFGTMMFSELEHTVTISLYNDTVMSVSCTQNTDEGNPNYELGFEKTHDGVMGWYLAHQMKTIHGGNGYVPKIAAELSSEITTLLNSHKQLFETLYASEHKPEYAKLVAQAKEFMTT